MQSALREDALTTSQAGFAVRVGLPWIRSLPLACVRDPVVTIDGKAATDTRVAIGDRRLTSGELIHESTWWFAQDRLVLTADTQLEPGSHDVLVEFGLLIPYLMAGPGGGPLELPMRVAARLELDHPPVPSVSLDVA
jgi:hypothetical protein